MFRVKLDRFSPSTAVVNYIPNFCACAKFVAPQWPDYFKVGGTAPVPRGDQEGEEAFRVAVFIQVNDMETVVFFGMRTSLSFGVNDKAGPAPPTSTTICPPTECEIKAFYEELKKSGKPSLLSIVPGYCDEYIVESTDLPTPLSELFQWECLKLSYTDLISKFESVFSNLAVTASQAKRVESLTRVKYPYIWFSMGTDHSNPYIHSTTVLCDYQVVLQCWSLASERQLPCAKINLCRMFYWARIELKAELLFKIAPRDSTLTIFLIVGVKAGTVACYIHVYRLKPSPS